MSSNSTSLPPPPPAAAVQALYLAATHLRIEDSFVLIATTAIFYDYILNLPDEIELIWKRKKNTVSYVFLLLRYFTLVAFIPILVALFTKTWTLDRCHNFAKFEGVSGLVTVMLAEIILMLRIYAIYESNKIVLGGMLVVYVTQFVLLAFTLARSGPVVIPVSKVTYGCVLVGDPKYGNLDLLFVVPNLFFDCMALSLLTIGIIRKAQISKSMSRLGGLMLRDGLFYFSVVFAFNLSWTLTGVILPTDLKNIMALLTTAVTQIFICRLTLNLKKHGSSLVNVQPPQVAHTGSNGSTTHRSWLRSRVAGLLGVSMPRSKASTANPNSSPDHSLGATWLRPSTSDNSQSSSSTLRGSQEIGKSSTDFQSPEYLELGAITTTGNLGVTQSDFTTTKAENF